MASDLYFERGLIGALMLPDTSPIEAASIIGEADFSDEACRAAWAAIYTMHLRRESWRDDPMTLAHESGIDPEWYREIVRDRTIGPHPTRYARRIRERSLERKAVRVGFEIQYALADETIPLAERKENVRRLLDTIGESNADTMVPMSAVMDEIVEEWEEIAQGRVHVIPTGFRDIDEAFLPGGLVEGRQYVIGARTGMGKTSFIMSILRHASLRLGKHCLFFQGEMARTELGRNVIASESWVDTRKLTYPDEETAEAIGKHWKSVAESRLWIDDTPRPSVSQIESIARKWHERGMCDLLAVDYLQIMEVQRDDRRDIELGEASMRLKQLARELKIPVIILAQLSRAMDKRATTKEPAPRPRASDLGESGKIEQNADGVILLHRPFYYTRDPLQRNYAQAIFEKNRGGPTGDVRLRWTDFCVRFDNPDDHDHGAEKSIDKQAAAAAGFGTGGRGSQEDSAIEDDWHLM